jgi:hypothetical protein
MLLSLMVVFKASFNPNWTWGAITIYPALVQDGITLNVTDAITSLTYNKNINFK